MPLDPVIWPTPVPIAHRGSRLLWPENTMEAFAGSVAMGYRHLETDLHLTADGVLVCHHDPTVDRTTNGQGRVAELAFAELSALDAGHGHAAAAGFPYRGKGVRVPALEEVVSSFPESALVLDLKMDGLARDLAALIDRHRLHERVIVGSFSDARIAEFRLVTGGRVATSVGQAAARRWLIAARAGRPGPGRPAAIQLPVRSRGIRTVHRGLVDAAKAVGAQVHVWTVNRERDMTQLLDLGVGGIISDRPDTLKEVLTRRGEWRL